LAPVVSYLWLRGRCHGCAAPIPARAPLIEAGTAALALACWIALGPTPAALVAFGQLAVLGLITVVDLEHRRVLNQLVLPALPLAALAAPLWPGLTLADSLLGGLAGFGTLLLVALLRPGALGMGDVKLAALTGLLTGLSHLVTALLAAFIGGGAVAIVLLLTGRIGRRDALPFAPFLCLGTVVALLL
jgi:leader peptidase (prepilin peptidase)/N-methyltransferase